MPESRRCERGFVAIEFALAVGLLLLPVVMLVAALPSWVEREHAATVAAAEAAGAAVRAYPGDGGPDARSAALDTLHDYGITATDIDVVVVRDDHARGGTVSVRVTVTMPALVVPGVGAIGGFHWSRVQSRRIDDYRSS
jgi:hypothetical protein